MSDIWVLDLWLLELGIEKFQSAHKKGFENYAGNLNTSFRR